VESINQTDYTPLRLRPVAVSIETNTPDGMEREGKTQLCVWAAAHVLRVRSLAGLDKVDITFPLVLVVGSTWTLFFLTDQGDELVSFCSSSPSSEHGLTMPRRST